MLSAEPVEHLYPPTSYVVPPPPGGVDGLDLARRSGIPVVDAILDAAQAGDVATMADLIDYRPVECSEPGQIGSLPCPNGTPPGTPLDALPITACEGGFALPDEAPARLVELAAGRPSTPSWWRRVRKRANTS